MKSPSALNGSKGWPEGERRDSDVVGSLVEAGDGVDNVFDSWLENGFDSDVDSIGDSEPDTVPDAVLTGAPGSSAATSNNF
jgi:hypothetical protein